MPEVMTRVARPLPVVHIPSQTSIGFEVVVPTKEDAKALGRFIEHSRLGKGRLNIQPVYSLKAVELKWAPASGMPPLRDFAQVVQAWARRSNYLLARDMRELRQGLDLLRGGKTADLKLHFVRLASAPDEWLENVVESAYFHTNNGGLTLQLVECSKVASQDSTLRYTYRVDYSLSSMGVAVRGSFDIGSAPQVQWLIEALTRVLPKVQKNQTWVPFEAPKVTRMDGQDMKSAAMIAARFKAAALDDSLPTVIESASKLLSDLDKWASKFPQVLKKADSEGLPLGWVWQDVVAQFFNEYDTKFFQRHQDLDFELSDLSFSANPSVSKIAGVVHAAVKEPTGKAALMYGLNKLKFFPHPEKGEHIAYPIGDLKVWHQAFSAWVTNGSKVLKEQARKKV